MAIKKSSPKAPGLKGFFNSPRFGKAFKALLVLLIVGAAGYGGYLLFNERFSSAASGAFYQDSKGITHSSGGQAIPGLNNKTKVWKTGFLDFGKVVWGGPKKELSANKQYLACFYYTTYNKSHGLFPGLDIAGTQASATIDVVNGSQTIRAKKITAPGRPIGTTGYDRTCLPFFLENKANDTEFRFRNVFGTLFIRKTTIQSFDKSQAKSFLGKTKDNSSVITGRYYED